MEPIFSGARDATRAWPSLGSSEAKLTPPLSSPIVAPPLELETRRAEPTEATSSTARAQARTTEDQLRARIEGGGDLGFLGGFGKLPPRPAEGRPRAEAALAELAPPAADHPVQRHVDEVRSQLAAEGLPTNAEGSKVYVVGETGVHGGSVARSVAGPAAIGRGADLQLLDPAELPADAKAEARGELDNRVMSGNGTLADAREWAIDYQERHVRTLAAELENVRERGGGEGTKIVNASFGTNTLDMTYRLGQATGNNNDAPLAKDVNRLREARGERALDLGNPEDKRAFNREILDQVQAARESPEGQARIDAALADLGTETAAARKAGILPLVSSGNAHADFIDARYTTDPVSSVPGIVMIGASDLGASPLDAKDDKMLDASSPGAKFAAPGKSMPVAPMMDGTAGDEDGTSFASAYAAGVAATMLKANPALSPDDIEAIWAKTSRDIAGTRDGGGVIDEVAAVRAAKTWPN
jgi:hypothetical protein